MNYLKRKITARFVVFLTVIMIVFWSVPCNFAFGEVQEGSELPEMPGSEQSEAVEETAGAVTETAEDTVTEEATEETTNEITEDTAAEEVTEETATDTTAETTNETTEDTVTEITEETATEETEEVATGTTTETATEETVETAADTTDAEATLLPDTTPPVITIIGGSPVMVELGSIYADAGATATDDVDGDLTSSIKVVDTVDTTAPGSYKVTYNVSDKAGNAAAEVTRIVNVVNDLVLPVITIIGESPVMVELGSAYVDAGATATDDVDGDLTGSIEVLSTVDTAVPGSYEVTYNVSDRAGNAAAEVTRIVNVVGKPTVATDKDDYSPGEIVVVTGSGWLPGETVKLDFVILPLQLTLTYYALTDSEGNIYNNEYIIFEHHLGQTIILTATGQTTGLSAMAVFTDSPRVTLVTVGAQSPNPVYTPNNATYTVTINRGAYIFYIDLSITTTLPSGCAYNFSPNHIYCSGGTSSITSTLTITTDGTTPAGSTSFTVRADSGTSGDYATGSRTLVVADATAPTGSLNINSGAVATTTRGVTLNLSATDAVGVTGYRVANNTDASGAGTTTVTSTTSYSANRSWTLTTGNGTKTVAVQYRDAAGNWSPNYTDTIVYDTGRPTVSLTAYLPDPTGDNTPTYSGSAADTLTNIVTIQYRVDSGSWTNVDTFTQNTNVNFTFTTSALSVGSHTIRVRAYDAAGNVSTTVSDTLTITTGTPPTITGQPSSATKTVGESVTFTVVASGTAPLNYQWRKGGASISGATNSTYTINSIIIANAGSYDVVVTNAYGSATSNTATLTVNKATPTITWDNPADIVYGTALDGAQLNATASVPGSFVYTPAAGTILNEGAGQNLRVDFTPTDTANYNSATKTVQINVTPKSVTVTANSGQSKVYGDSDPVLTYTSSDPSVTLTGSLSRDAGEDVGSYGITQGTLTAGGNYTISFISADFTITAGDITVTADAKSKVYGDSDPVLTYTSSDPSVTLTGSLSRDAGEDVGSYTITQGTLALSDNYKLNYVGADLVITPAALTITADNKSKTYGQANPDFTVSYVGFISGDDSSVLGGTLSFDCVAVDNSPVGNYPITPSGLTSSNYTISFIPGFLTVEPKALTITASDKIKVYGDPLPEFTTIYSGFVAGDDETNLDGTLSITTTATADSPVGTYPITPSGLNSTNYNITFLDGTLTVTAAPLTVTADDASRLYGDANPLFNGTIIGIVNSDNITATYDSPALVTDPVGTYPIISILSDPDGKLGNYTVTIISGTLTVNPVPLTITADDTSKIYGDPNPAFSVTYSGFAAGDDESDLLGTLEITTTAVTDSPVGTYPITPSGLNSTNYNITFVDGTLTVTAVTTSLSVSPASGTYGGTVDLSAALSPAVGGKTISFTLNGNSVGDAATDANGVAELNGVSLSGINAGSYPTGVGASFAGDSNYSASSDSDSLTVTAAPLTTTTGDDVDEKLEANIVAVSDETLDVTAAATIVTTTGNTDGKLEESIVAVSGETSDITIETLTINAGDDSDGSSGGDTIAVNDEILDATAIVTADDEVEPDITVAGITSYGATEVSEFTRLSPIILISGIGVLAVGLILLFIYLSRMMKLRKFNNILAQDNTIES